MKDQSGTKYEALATKLTSENLLLKKQLKELSQENDFLKGTKQDLEIENRFLNNEAIELNDMLDEYEEICTDYERQLGIIDEDDEELL